ncbi:MULTISPECIES: polysaccharide biosynthesis protein [Bacillus]|uniref:NAD-dependent epimerase/dehydratase family protein n=1 Tax=Bacillus glycinifermentans TaxID=1664069 RepID=A0AAJ3Z243_9BACI|nr:MULTISPECIES: polysaccharide biosynthesis protein [Bacillus]KKB75213.1 UDP-N-acetylglucosamine 4,6-dehydratase [Bacillus sp. TH008]MDU0071660.1 polysaccharide biosynthesis protein [Bacillus sp. IG6]MED8019994.1 polysaccharide biosynthesis protein [Bacillus glycinifermentans]QAT67501.1 NAD-dependent epimerase/dehydratase family protein [Bacillus glycinifermentans]WKB77155.1 polysaccharide biosynthesis protein [Bacillus glycinifermentans]
MFKNARILLTGGTGSWGTELTKKLLLYKPKEIRIFSRNEFTQIGMQREFNHHPSLTFIIGDVRDYLSLESACQDIDYIFHLAALKHVPICEGQPDEALKTNVVGTQNVIRAALVQRVKKVIDVSTDKAADPVNFYGMTKALGERLMIRANDYSGRTDFVCIRGGNVLGTNGSVVPLFKRFIEKGEDLTLTSKEMTRFFLTVGEAIDLLLKASEEALGGEIFVMKMKACNILDLAEVLIEEMGSSVGIKEIGIRPGEKLHEVLVSDHEVPYTYLFDSEHYVILPSHPSEKLARHYRTYPKATFEKYQSNDLLMTKPEIAELLREGGFIK